MIKVGDKVVMNENYIVPEKNKGKVFTVSSNPKMICGTMCVWLEGYKGCYAIDGLNILNVIEQDELKEMEEL